MWLESISFTNTIAVPPIEMPAQAHRRYGLLGPAFDHVKKGNSEGLLQCRGLDFMRTYDDMAQKSRVTLLGLCVLDSQFECMMTLLWMGANPNHICASFEFRFAQWKRWINLTGRDMCATNEGALITLHLFETRRAQLSAMQWVLVNIPACWRDLSEDILRRLRYA